MRYYERRRLLPRAARTGGGFRLFSPEAVERIRFIKQAQDIGLSLEEIEQLLASGGGAKECRGVRDLLRTKIDELEERMKVMKEFRNTLSRHLAACERELGAHGESASCPVMVDIARLNKPGDKRKQK